MAKFDKAIELTLKNEGGFVDDKADTGGATKYGISLKFLATHGIDINKDGKVDKGDILILTVDDAKKLYRDNFWKFDALNDQLLANKLFDMSVLCGVGQAVALVQRACNYVAGSKLADDGKFGDETLAMLNAKDALAILATFKDLLIAHFYKCVEHAPAKNKFLQGWLKRAVQ